MAVFPDLGDAMHLKPTLESVRQHLSRVPGGRDRDEEGAVGILCTIGILLPIAQVETFHTSSAKRFPTSITSQTPLLAQGRLFAQCSRSGRSRRSGMGHLRYRALQTRDGTVERDRTAMTSGVKLFSKTGVMR